MIPKRIKKKETKVINSLSEKEDEINNNKYIIKKEEKKERQNIYDKYRKKEQEIEVDKQPNKTLKNYNYKTFEINKETKENNITTSKLSLKKYETNTRIINNNKNKFIQMDKKPLDESRNKSEDKYKINVGDKNVKAMKEKEGNLIINIIFLQ